KNPTLPGSGIVNFGSGGNITGTLGVTGGNWNGQGSVAGLVTSSSGAFTIGSGANLTANGGLNVTGGTLAAGSATSQITGNLNYSSASGSTFAGVIAGGSVTKGGASVLGLTGNNTFTGALSIDNGTLTVATINASPTVAHPLGQADATFNLGSTTPAVFEYTCAGP